MGGISGASGKEWSSWVGLGGWWEELEELVGRNGES